MKVLGLIPARGGSKGVPGKNIKPLAGIPLIEYAIAAALNSKLLTNVVVSTDSPDIARISEKAGAEVPFIRPDYLATDDSATIDLVIHAVDFLHDTGRDYEAICLLQPTSPFRPDGFIDKAVKKFIKSGSDSLITVLPLPEKFNPHWIFEISSTDSLRLATGEDKIIKRRQDLPPAYYRDGSIYLTRISVIKEMHSLYGRSIGYVVSDQMYHVNIDNSEDWLKAEETAIVLQKGNPKEFEYLFKS